MYQYKILTERDRRFAGGFDADTLEATLNSYAHDGWRVLDVAVAANPMKTAKAEMLIVLERAAQ